MLSRLSPNAQGAALMVSTMAFFAMNDAVVKLAGQQLELWQMITMRGVLASALIAALAWRFGALRLPRGRDAWAVTIRSAMEVAATYFFLTALMTVPLATLTAILQMLPLTVTLAAAVFLGEKVGWRRSLAIGLGFVGMLLIVRPGPEGLGFETIYALLAVVVLTARDMATRLVSPAVPSLSIACLASVAVTVFGVALGAAEGWVGPQPSLGDWGMMGLAAVLIFLAYLTSVMTMRVGEVSAIAPFRYAGLLWALVLGWLVFGDWPDNLTLLGAAIVVAAGLFTLRRAAQLEENTQPEENTEAT